MGYCPSCGKKINELRRRKVYDEPVRFHEEESGEVLRPSMVEGRIRRWREFACPKCNEVITNDFIVAKKILEMSQLEAKVFEARRLDDPSEFSEDVLRGG